MPTSDGSATPDNLDGKRDNRGFTGHEMLDDLDLVHMNGRVYDPLSARFLSADPLIQDAVNGQSYNRYAYVMNNPTNLTDPSGFAGKCDAACEDQKAREEAQKEKDARRAIASGISITYVSGTAPNSANNTPANQTYVGMSTDGVPYTYQGPVAEPKSTWQKIKDGAGDLVEGALHAAEGIPGEGVVIGGLAKAGVSAEQTIQRVIIFGVKQVQAEAPVIQQGGLNLFKWGSQTTTTAIGWRGGDFMLHLPNRGSVGANWAQNSGKLREQMSKGQPIYDSFREGASGLQIPTKGFLGAERNLLESRGWQYNPAAGAYYPPLP